MRDANVILRTTGDDPLTELVELDEFYGWTRRISILKSIFSEKKKKSVIPILIGVTFVTGAALIGSYIAIYYLL